MSLWEDSWAPFPPKPSFVESVSDPGTDPEEGPFVCVQFNQAWLPFVCGALLQLCQPPTWGLTNSSDPSGVLARATKLLNLFGLAGACEVTQRGIVPLTIPNGDAVVSTPITFPTPFPAIPIVIVATDNPDLVPAWSGVTPEGMTVELSAAVDVTEDTAGILSWVAVS